MLIPACEIAELQDAFEGLLSDEATIKRATETPDGYGGVTKTFANVATKVPCLRSRESIDYDQARGAGAGNDQLWRFRFLATQDIRVADRVVIGSDTYEVVGPTETGTLAVLNRVICKLL